MPKMVGIELKLSSTIKVQIRILSTTIEFLKNGVWYEEAAEFGAREIDMLLWYKSLPSCCRVGKTLTAQKPSRRRASCEKSLVSTSLNSQAGHVELKDVLPRHKNCSKSLAGHNTTWDDLQSTSHRIHDFCWRGLGTFAGVQIIVQSR